MIIIMILTVTQSMLYDKKRRESRNSEDQSQWRVAGGFKLNVIRWRLTNVKPSATTLVTALLGSDVTKQRIAMMPSHRVRAFNVGAIFGG